MTDPTNSPADQDPKNIENAEDEIAANSEENDAGLDNYSQDDEGAQAQTLADEAAAAQRRRRDDNGGALGAAASDPGTQAAVEAEQRSYGGPERRQEKPGDSESNKNEADTNGGNKSDNGGFDGGGADGGGGD